MLRPLYERQHSHKTVVEDELMVVLLWWRSVLALEIVEVRSWFAHQCETAYLFADASGSAAHTAAILFIGERVLYTDWAPDTEFLDMFHQRRDKQIMGLEMIAIALGLCVFESELRNKHVMLYTDNVGAEGAIKKGSAKSFDHCKIAHSIWLKLVQLQCSVFCY